jgi:hypothetical protein
MIIFHNHNYKYNVMLELINIIIIPVIALKSFILQDGFDLALKAGFQVYTKKQFLKNIY